ncbi:MAG: hypothetical protein WC969_08605 [Elusimicrobiota bacterium]|jgi:hypothetical protein
MAHEETPSRWPLILVLAGTFLSFLLAPLYMSHLRAKAARELPARWESVGNNGSFAYASPLLITAKNIEEGIYAIKVAELLRRGLPYDPYLGDRSLKSWLFDCLMFFPLAPFVLLAGGSLHWGWVLAAASFATLWVLLFQQVLRRWSGDARLALLGAVGLFFFIDSVVHLFLVVHFPLRALPNWAFLFLAYATGQVQWMRLPTPGMTALMLALALAGLFALAASGKRRPLSALLCGLLLSLLALAHPFEWVYGVGTGALFLAAAWGLGAAPATLFNLALANAVSLPLSGAYYALAGRLTRDVVGDVILRCGIYEREFKWPALFFLLWAALFWRKALKADGTRRLAWGFWASGACLVFFSGGISLLTGYELQFYGHLARIGAVALALASLCWALERPERLAWARRHALVLVAVVFAWVFLREKAWSDTHYRIFGTPRHMEEGLRWAKEKLPAEAHLLSISGPTTQQIALNVGARALVSDGATSYSMPLSTERILRGFARTLKTAGADPERILADRYDDFVRKDDLKQQTAYFNRDVSLERAEEATWPVFLLAYEGIREARRLLHRDEILRYYREEKPLPPPYWLWVGKLDEPYLSVKPEKRGGRLVFENPGVRIYQFK